MKRHEMILVIAKALKDQWDKEYGPKLKGSTYIGYSIAEGYKQAKVALDAAEANGMLPPILPKYKTSYIEINPHTGTSMQIEDYHQWEKQMSGKRQKEKRGNKKGFSEKHING